jgi:hypothetical protein
MENKVVALNLTINAVTNKFSDESHALLVRSGFLRQVPAPNSVDGQLHTHHMTRLTQESSISFPWASGCKTKSKH